MDSINIGNLVASYSKMINGGGDFSQRADFATSGSGAFGEMIKKSSRDTMESLRESEKYSLSSIGSDSNVELHQIVTKLMEAESKLQLMVSIRDKLVSAIQEVTKMQI